MAREDFTDRLARIGETAPLGTSEGSLSVPEPPRSGPSIAGYVWGAVASLAILLLFNNIQAISDMAPDSVAQGDTPGAWGAPVAILSVVWFAVIPLWFAGSFILGALRRKGSLGPAPFVTGAFVGLAIGMLIMKLVIGGGAA